MEMGASALCVGDWGASKPATLTGSNNNYLASAGGALSRIDNKLTRAAKKT